MSRTYTKDAIRAELQRVHAAGEQLNPDSIMENHINLYQVAARLYRNDGGYVAAVRDAGLPVTWIVRGGERTLYGVARNYSTSHRRLVSLLELLPVGLIVTNGDGISVARTDEHLWEANVYGYHSLETCPSSAAKWIVSKASARSVLAWVRSVGA